MKVLVQRVTGASVSVGGEVVGKIGQGLVALVGVAEGDDEGDIDYLVPKMTGLRIFADEEGKFNISALDINGELLLISQFTLMADTRKGKRPSFTGAAVPEQAVELFNAFVEKTRQTGLKVKTGRFQEYMQVEIHNDGPVTIMLDSSDRSRPRKSV
ncbi:MAG: D-tyrosyl-tRNA(Tyr) deacylase [Dehalococcoidales bacterium]|nr:D-tyrosyl-tRNA(Tyr) deacylase [Dehalococcoidales bacterium]